MSDLGLVAAVIAATVISLAAVFWVVLPLLQPGRGDLIVEDDRLSQLLTRKDATLRAIKELEFDYHVGKIEEEDYKRLDQRLRRQAIGYMQQIEKLAPDMAALDDALEAEIAKRRKTHAVPTGALAAESKAANGSGAHAPDTPSGEVRFCTNCGMALEPTHKFCANCGTPVHAPAATAQPDAQPNIEPNGAGSVKQDA